MSLTDIYRTSLPTLAFSVCVWVVIAVVAQHSEASLVTGLVLNLLLQWEVQP